MLTPRNKIIILIVGALIVLAVIVSTVFNLWPGGGEPEAPAPEPVDLSFLKQESALPAGQVFDASNKAEFAALTGDTATEAELTPLEKAARDLAEFFVERFGTYSPDALGAQIDDLQSFMTPSMQSWTANFKSASPPRDGYFAATAVAASADQLAFSAAEHSARFLILTNRTETTAQGVSSYQQPATVELRQDSGGQWKVNSLVWGEKR